MGEELDEDELNEDAVDDELLLNAALESELVDIGTPFTSMTDERRSIVVLSTTHQPMCPKSFRNTVNRLSSGVLAP